MHALAVFVIDSDFEMGQRVGRVLGVVLFALLAIWLLFVARWSRNEGQGGFFFRLAVIILPLPFALGTLRSGFHLGARISALSWMLVIAAEVVVTSRQVGKRANANPRDLLEKGCVQTAPTLPSSTCACLADAYVSSHSRDEIRAVIERLDDGEPVLTRGTWANAHVNGCAAQAPQGPVADAPVDQTPPAIAQTSCALSSEPPGAEIFIDGKPTGQVTPAEVTVWAGRSNLLEVKLDGHLPESFRVEPNLNEKTAHRFQLRPGAEVRHSSEPPGAQVFLDGEKRGISPGTTWVAAGHQTLVFKAPGCVDTAVELNVEAKPIDLPVRLPPSAQLKVSTFPRGADVSVDGKPVSGSSLAISADEKHFLTATMGGFIPSTQAVAPMTAGDRDSLTLTLEEGDREHFGQCVRKLSATVKRLQKSRVGVSSAASRATASKRPALEQHVLEVDREIAARTVALEACQAELHRAR